MSIEVLFKKLDPRARLPQNAYGNDAGWDLFCLEATTIREGQGRDIRTGLAVAIPEGYFGRIVARSSTMRKRGLLVLEGIIDAGFRGELFSYVYMPVGHKLPKTTDTVYIGEGESVAQLIIQKAHPIIWLERKELPVSNRGVKGFGSSGN